MTAHSAGHDGERPADGQSLRGSALTRGAFVPVGTTSCPQNRIESHQATDRLAADETGLPRGATPFRRRIPALSRDAYHGAGATPHRVPS